MYSLAITSLVTVPFYMYTIGFLYRGGLVPYSALVFFYCDD